MQPLPRGPSPYLEPLAFPAHAGTLGDTWPFFRPNYVNMEALAARAGAQEARAALSLARSGSALSGRVEMRETRLFRRFGFGAQRARSPSPWPRARGRRRRPLAVRFVALPPNPAARRCRHRRRRVPQVVGFVPTGWVHEMKKAPWPVRAKGPLSVALIPYRRGAGF
jgi:hypothetical protein